MPWNLETMKDVTTCEKQGGAGVSYDPLISEWGNPVQILASSWRLDLIGAHTEGIETS